MRIRGLYCALLLMAAGCGAGYKPTLPKSTAIHFPATWTPAPTSTSTPPPPTATLVIQSEPSNATAGAGNVRRYPVAADNSIGMWVDSTHMSSDVAMPLASRAQLATGPQASAMRQINSRLIALERLDLTDQADGAPFTPGDISSGYDGVLVERVSTGANLAPYSASNKLLGSARDALGSRILIASAYAWSDGAAFKENSADSASLIGRVDGVCLCSFLRSSAAPLSEFKSELQWKKDVDALAGLSNYPNLIVLVATPFEHVADQEVQLLQAWLDYALASFLIGENGQYAYFSLQGPRADEYMGAGEFDTPLGAPMGSYYTSYGIYARHFQHGLVVVNAGDSLREMPLARMYASGSGDQVSSVRLEPHSGEILLIVP